MERDQQMKHQAITLPEPTSPRGSYSSPGYYVIDQAGNPVSDRYDSQALAYANLHGGAGVSYLDQPQQGHLNQPWPPELHTVVGHTGQGEQMYTEADLLRAMASTSDLDEQRYLMGALEEVRRDARTVMAGANQVDFEPPNHVGEMRAYHPYHSGAFGASSATDWLAEMGASDDGMTEHMLTMGSRFFIGCHPEVKADPVEYMTQALGVARVAASQFNNIEAAVTIFMEHAANLARVDLSKIAQEELLPWEAPPEQLPPVDSEYPGPYSQNQNTEVNPEPSQDGRGLPGLDNGASARAVQGAAVLSSHQHMSEFLFDPPTPEELAQASGPANLNQQFGAPATSHDDSAGAEQPAQDQTGVAPVVASRKQAADTPHYVAMEDRVPEAYYENVGKVVGRGTRMDRPIKIVQTPHRGAGQYVSDRVGSGLYWASQPQDHQNFEGVTHEGSRAFNPDPTSYEEYLARLAPGSAGVTQEFFSGAAAARGPSANDVSVPEWGKRQRPKASVTQRPTDFRGVTAANEDMLNPQAFERADESDAPAIRPQSGGSYDPKDTWAQSGEAAHDATGLIPQTDLGEEWSNISDFPDTGEAEVPSTRAPFVGNSIRVAADDDDDEGKKTGGPQDKPGAYEPDRGLYSESPEGQAEATEGYEEAYSSGRMIDYTGAGVDTLGTVPVQGYDQDASHPNGEMWPWEQNSIGSPPAGAAAVADVPTPGMISAQQTGSSWPQPNVTKNSKLDAFRANIAAHTAKGDKMLRPAQMVPEDFLDHMSTHHGVKTLTDREKHTIMASPNAMEAFEKSHNIQHDLEMPTGHFYGPDHSHDKRPGGSSGVGEVGTNPAWPYLSPEEHAPVPTPRSSDQMALFARRS